MAQFGIDTLSVARELEAAGAERKQAEATATAINDAVATGYRYLSTKDDLRQLEQATKNDLSQLEQSTKSDLRQLEKATKDGLSQLEKSTKSDLSQLEKATKNGLRQLEQATKSDLRQLEDKMATKSDLHQVERRIDRLEGKMETGQAALKAELFRGLWIQGGVIVAILGTMMTFFD